MRKNNFFAASFASFNIIPTFVNTITKGRVAEWLGWALQNLLQRFESGRDLIST